MPDLATHLRAETSGAHHSLETSLDLLRRPADRQGFLEVLERFHGFHAVWEGAIRTRSTYAAFHASRARLPHLRRDLAALGRTTAEMRMLPHCLEADALVDGAARTLGSIYVLEGSTLGGQVIARELADSGWLPRGGLTYFNPHGRRTGEMWRGFRTWLGDQEVDWDETVEGARRTFALLESWAAR
ncbi:biliverdin-producing heme oxygenase [Phenylobacterium sp. J367]|uniref:biliverdin-producing heme oxygenase n=1 Tax=Phenylobacterium sp. J367 TaxID=2898435 RepID=UPI0021507D7E|nr:biliverdin-producing heme oxygenase [Phenylobacterium sp. J367]MCR5880942.1 biliverdin-producing heme oxygenase [Phenylobacterium sp. J367]